MISIQSSNAVFVLSLRNWLDNSSVLQQVLLSNVGSGTLFVCGKTRHVKTKSHAQTNILEDRTELQPKGVETIVGDVMSPSTISRLSPLGFCAPVRNQVRILTQGVNTVISIRMIFMSTGHWQ